MIYLVVAATVVGYVAWSICKFSEAVTQEPE
jgi:hypothetical protein